MTEEQTAPVPSDGEPTLEEWLRGVLADIIGVEDPNEIKPDSDGDYSLTLGSALTYIRILPDPQRLRIFSILVLGAIEHPDLFVQLNRINGDLEIGSVHLSEDRIIFKHTVLAESLAFGDVRTTLVYFTEMADTYDHKLQERFGGATAFRQERGDEIDV